MIETERLVSTEEKVCRLLDAEVVIKEGSWIFHKKRMPNASNSSKSYVNRPLNLSVAFSALTENKNAVNKAKVFMLPEELPIFTRALIRHPISFPTTYSQEVSMDQGIYCIRLESLEQPEDFAIRLVEALYTLR